MAVNNSTNLLNTSKYIVDPTAGNGMYTTIGAAITAATGPADIFIRPGTYTENITMKSGVNLVGFFGDSIANVEILGKISVTAGGTYTISNIILFTNSDFLLSVSGSAGPTVTLNNCSLICTSSGISFSTSGGGSITLNNCTGDISAGQSYWVITANAFLYVNYCKFGNSSGCTTASTNSTGFVSIYASTFLTPISSTSTGSVSLQYSRIDSQNVVALTANGTGGGICEFSLLSSGSASSLSVGSGVTFQIDHSVMNSTNTNAITGAGTIQYNSIGLANSTAAMNVSVQTQRKVLTAPISFDGGTNFLSTYAEGSFTPTITGTGGTTTYTVQSGKYVRVGNVVTVWGNVSASAITATGSVVLGALPFTIKNQSNYSPVGTVLLAASGWAYPASTTSLVMQGALNQTNAVANAQGTSSAAPNLQITNAAVQFLYTMTYQI